MIDNDLTEADRRRLAREAVGGDAVVVAATKWADADGNLNDADHARVVEGLQSPDVHKRMAAMSEVRRRQVESERGALQSLMARVMNRDPAAIAELNAMNVEDLNALA